MQVIGFNLTKISAEKIAPKISKSKKGMGFEFTGVEKDKVDLLKDLEATRIVFKHNISYEGETEGKKDTKLAELIFEGNIILALTKDESKDVYKAWKKKQVPNNLRMGLSNVILQRCTARAIDLQHELGIPSHVALPRISTPSNQPQEDN